MNMLAQTQIVVYRSQFERDRDQFLYDNADYILYAIVGALALGLIIAWVDKIRRR